MDPYALTAKEILNILDDAARSAELTELLNITRVERNVSLARASTLEAALRNVDEIRREIDGVRDMLEKKYDGPTVESYELHKLCNALKAPCSEVKR
jgi:hypothetical protein